MGKGQDKQKDPSSCGFTLNVESLRQKWDKGECRSPLYLNTRLSPLLPSMGLPGQATNQFIPEAYGKLPPFPEQRGLALIPFPTISVHLRKPGIHSFHSLM